MSTQKVDASIMGQSYILAAPESEVADLQMAVAKVDEAMCKIRDAGKIRARDRIAVLAALNLAFDLVEREQAGGFNGSAAAAPSRATDSADGTELLHPRMQSLLHRMEDLLAQDGKLL